MADLAAEKALADARSGDDAVSRLLTAFSIAERTFEFLTPSGDAIVMNRVTTESYTQMIREIGKFLEDVKNPAMLKVLLGDVQNVKPDATKEDMDTDRTIYTAAYMLHFLSFSPKIPIGVGVLLCRNAAFYSAFNQALDAYSGMPTSMRITQSEIDNAKKKPKRTGATTGQ